MHQVLQAIVIPNVPPVVSALFFAVALWAGPALGESRFRVAAWNIADFHHKAGVEAREHIGTRRYAADFKALKKYADEIDADIIALQEIVTREAAELLFPPDQYALFMSTRYAEDRQAGRDSDIYTAVAVRKSAAITFLRQSDFSDLQIQPNGDNPYERSTRRGTAVELEINGEPVWVMSVHLKSSCATVIKLDRSRQDSCKMLWQQSLSLKRWIDDHLATSASFIIAGDFNRRFGRLKNRGAMWKLLTRRTSRRSVKKSNTAGGSLVVRFPATKLRKCPTRKGKGVHPIDWFVVNASFAERFLPDTYFETRWSRSDVSRHRNRLSDHCPIHIDFEIDPE